MNTRSRPGLSGTQAGFSLIELMIASVIGLILLAGVVLIAINASRTERELEQAGRQLENGRYAMQILEGVIPHAGYYGDFSDPANGATANPPCSTDPVAIANALWWPIQGYDSPTGDPPPTCIDDADHVDGTDILVIRRASTMTTDMGDLQVGELYLQSRFDSRVLTVADASPAGEFNLTNRAGTAPAEIRKFRVDIFFLSPDGDDVPTLTRLSLRADGTGTLTWVEEPLVAGIEQFQVDYGIDRNGDGAPEESSPGSSNDAYMTLPPANREPDVMSVRIHLIARSIESVNGYTDEKTYDLGVEDFGGAAGDWNPADDSFRRRAFVSTIRAHNLSIRRE